MKKSKKLIVRGVIMLVPLLVVMATSGVMKVKFKIGCEGRLKRAADANTVQTAAIELDAALAYMEEHKLTSGYTSVLWQSPDDDIGFWYKNLKEARVELDKVTEESSQLEKSNVLMKLRETILDSKEKGTVVTAPPGVSRYPSNAMMGTFALVSAAFAMAGLCFIAEGYCMID
jgi:hypothetical protein